MTSLLCGIFKPNKLISTMDEKQIRGQFRIRISGIELGKHCFSISCTKEFFELAELDKVQDGSVDLRVEMEKSEKMVDYRTPFRLHFIKARNTLNTNS